MRTVFSPARKGDVREALPASARAATKRTLRHKRFIGDMFYCFSGVKNNSSVRESSQRARRCITRFTRRHSGFAPGLIASARLSRDLNSFTSCFWTSTASASATNGPASCPPQSSTARSKWLRARNHFDRARSEEHTSELQSRENLVCRLLLEKKKKKKKKNKL